MERFNFREYINLVESHQIINEGQADVMYKQMIDSVKKVIDTDPEKFETKQVTSWVNNMLPQEWERLTSSDTFKQLSNPWKIYIVRMLISSVNNSLKKWFPDEFKNKKVAYPNTKIKFPDMLDKLKHLSGINYPKLKLYSPPQNKTPEQVIDDLDDLEQEYIDSTGDNMITPDGSEEVIKDFGDVAWFNLGRGSCDIEGNAMGHCGNVPSERPGDEVLSLRKKEMIDGIELHRSILTFIFNNGYLGEMKGRGNEKPAKRYHPYIVELLKLPMIEGILGGGYMAESNFSLSDLSPELLEEVREAKGEDFIKNEGNPAQLINSLMKDIESGRLTKLSAIASKYNDILEDVLDGDGAEKLSLNYDPKKDTLAIDIKQLNHTAEYIIKIITGNEDLYDDFSTVGDYEDFIRDHLPDAAMPSIINLFKQNLEEIKEALGDDELELDDINSTFVLDNVNELVQMGLLDGLEDALDRLNSDAIRIGAESEMIDALKSAVDEALSILGLDGIDYNLFELIDEDKFYVPVKPEQLRKMFSTVVYEANEGADFDELIKVKEPSYGFSGFDEGPIREYWSDSFADNDIEVIEISKEKEAA